MREDILVDGTSNVGGIGFYARHKISRTAFANFRGHLVGFQELTLEAKPAFEQHGLTFLMGEPAGDFYNAIAYDPLELDPIDAGMLKFDDGEHPAHDAGSVRNAQWVHFRTNTGVEFLRINTQLDNKGAVAREEAMRTILDFAERFPCPRKIIAGDLNMSVARDHPAWPEEKKRPYRMALERGYVDAYLAVRPGEERCRTFHHFQGQHCKEDEWGTYDTDYFLDLGVDVINCVFDLAMPPGSCTCPSDHYWGLQDVRLR